MSNPGKTAPSQSQEASWFWNGHMGPALRGQFWPPRGCGFRAAASLEGRCMCQGDEPAVAVRQAWSAGLGTALADCQRLPAARAASVLPWRLIVWTTDATTGRPTVFAIIRIGSAAYWRQL